MANRSHPDSGQAPRSGKGSSSDEGRRRSGIGCTGCIRLHVPEIGWRKGVCALVQPIPRKACKTSLSDGCSPKTSICNPIPDAVFSRAVSCRKSCYPSHVNRAQSGLGSPSHPMRLLPAFCLSRAQSGLSRSAKDFCQARQTRLLANAATTGVAAFARTRVCQKTFADLLSCLKRAPPIRRESPGFV